MKNKYVVNATIYVSIPIEAESLEDARELADRSYTWSELESLKEGSIEFGSIDQIN